VYGGGSFVRPDSSGPASVNGVQLQKQIIAGSLSHAPIDKIDLRFLDSWFH